MLANAEEGRWTAGREDSDAAASVEVPIHDCKKPTCIHVDEIAGKAHRHSLSTMRLCIAYYKQTMWKDMLSIAW